MRRGPRLSDSRQSLGKSESRAADKFPDLGGCLGGMSRWMLLVVIVLFLDFASEWAMSLGVTKVGLP